jgi:diacylglycerol kinase family enzyme
VLREREEQQKKVRNKWLGFAEASLSVLGQYSLLRVRLCLDGKELSRKTPFIFIGNNKYEMNGLHIGERRRLDAGELCLFAANRASRVELVRLAFRALFGLLREASDFDVLSTKQVSIETERPRTSVSTDGELNEMNTPLHYLVHPGALRVIVPIKSDPASGA